MSSLPDPAEIIRSRQYVALLGLAALLGVPISAVAYGFLRLVSAIQEYVFDDLPGALGFHSIPAWWPLPPLLVAGVLVALTIRYLPGTGGHSPADGFQAGGTPALAKELPGILFAALASLSLGAVIGPEAPLIAIGGGLGALAIRAARKDSPDTTVAIVAAAGSFAAISALFGSPLLGAFLLMEAAGLGAGMLDLVLLPGLLASGIGALVFLGLGDWTGWGSQSLTIPNLPHVARPDLAQFGWAIAIGLAAALIGAGLRWSALLLRGQVQRRLVLLTSVAGLVIAGLAIAYAQISGHPTSDVLFSGEDALGPLLSHPAAFSAGTLALLIACKGIAYSISLSSFRGGPVFPSMFLGAVVGILTSHLPGLPAISGAAMGIAAMCAVMLRLPLTSVLLATLLLGSAGLTVMPVVIVAVVVGFVAGARLSPRHSARVAARGMVS